MSGESLSIFNTIQILLCDRNGFEKNLNHCLEREFQYLSDMNINGSSTCTIQAESLSKETLVLED